MIISNQLMFFDKLNLAGSFKYSYYVAFLNQGVLLTFQEANAQQGYLRRILSYLN